MVDRDHGRFDYLSHDAKVASFETGETCIEALQAQKRKQKRSAGMRMSEGFYTGYKTWKWPNGDIEVVAQERFDLYDDDQHVVSVQFSPWRKRAVHSVQFEAEMPQSGVQYGMWERRSESV